MSHLYNKLSSFIGGFILLILIFISSPVNAQTVTNGSFEESNTGSIDTTDVKGWLIQVAQGINPAPDFEIVSDII